MAEDRWGKEIHPEFGWTRTDEPDSFTAIRIGREFFPEADQRLFYEKNLPDLRLFTWLLLDCLALQERAALDHGKAIPDDNRDALIERAKRLVTVLREGKEMSDGGS